MVPPVRGIHEMVAAANNFEVEAGYRILTQGGNAVDAGVASVLAASVTELSRFGLGGEMPLLIKMAGQPPSPSAAWEWRPPKPRSSSTRTARPKPWEEPNNMPPVPVQGILSAITPGVFDGLILALEKYGTKSFAQVAATRDRICRAKDFRCPKSSAACCAATSASWRFGRIRRNFSIRQGAAHAARRDLPRADLGPNLPRTRERGEEGPWQARQAKLRAVRDLFYKGDIAQRIAAFSENNRRLDRL